MNIYCDKISDTMINIIDTEFLKLKEEPLVYSFYFDFLSKKIFSYYKKDINEQKINKEIINFAIKQYIKEKIENKELAPRYIIHCFSCGKKLHSPISSLKEIPSVIVCPYCNAKINADTDYLDYDLRYIFANKNEPLLVKKNII